jgi:hypothetical protein
MNIRYNGKNYLLEDRSNCIFTKEAVPHMDHIGSYPKDILSRSTTPQVYRLNGNLYMTMVQGNSQFINRVFHLVER